MTREFIDRHGPELATCIYNNLVINRCPIVYPNFCFSYYRISSEGRKMCEFNGQNILWAPKTQVGLKTLLAGFLSFFSCDQPGAFPLFHAFDSQVSKVNHLITLYAHATRGPFGEYVLPDVSKFQNNFFFGKMKLAFSNPHYAAFSGYYLTDFDLRMEFVDYALVYDVETIIFGDMKQNPNLRNLVPEDKFTGIKVNLWLDNIPTYIEIDNLSAQVDILNKKLSAIQTSTLGNSTLYALKSKKWITAENPMLALMHANLLVGQTVEDRAIYVSDQQKISSKSVCSSMAPVASVDARDLFLSLVVKLILHQGHYEKVRQSWLSLAAVLHYLLQTIDPVNFPEVPLNKWVDHYYKGRDPKTIEAMAFDIQYILETFLKVAAEEGIGSEDQIAAVEGVVLEVLEELQIIKEDKFPQLIHLFEVILGIAKAEEKQLNFLFKMKYFTGFDFYTDSDKNTVGWSKTALEICGRDITYKNILESYDDYALMLIKINSQIEDKTPANVDVKTDVNIYKQHIDQEVLLFDGHRPDIFAADITSPLSELLQPEVSGPIEARVELAKVDPGTMSIAGPRQINPAEKKMSEILDRIPDLSVGVTDYCELSASACSFTKKIIEKCHDTLENVTLTMNTNDPSFNKEIHILSPSSPYDLDIKVINTNADFDKIGELRRLVEQIKKDRDKPNFLVYDIPISVETDAKLSDWHQTNSVTGFEVHKMPHILSAAEMRDKSFLRIAQAKYLIRSLLDVGGNFVFKVQHAETYASVLGLTTMSSSFSQAHLLRLDASKDTGTELYFVGIGYLLPPSPNLEMDGAMFDPVDVAEFLVNNTIRSLKNYYPLLSPYMAKLKARLSRRVTKYKDKT